MKGGKDGWRHAVLKAAGGLEGKSFHASAGQKDVPATLTQRILPTNITNGKKNLTWWLQTWKWGTTTLSATLLKQQHNLVPTAGRQRENESDTCACHVSAEHAAQANTPTDCTDLWLPTLSCWVGTATAEGGRDGYKCGKTVSESVCRARCFVLIGNNSKFSFGGFELIISRIF